MSATGLTGQQSLAERGALASGDDAASSSRTRRAFSRWVLAAFLLAISCYAALFPLFRHTLSWQTSDFTAYYRAGQMVVSGQGAQVYDYDAARRYDPALQTELAAVHEHLVLKRFVSAPFVLLIFAPLSRLSHYHAEILWYVVNVCLMLAWPLLLRDVLGRGRLMLFALLGPVFFIPVIVGMVQGQTSTLTLFLFALCYASLRQRRELLAGAALAMAAIKPQFVIPALLVLAVMKSWRAIAGFVAASLGLFAVSSCLVGWRTALSYPAAWVRFNVLPREMGGAHVEGMPNLRGMLYVLLHTRISSSALLLATLAITVALLGVLAVTASRRGASPLLLPLVICVTLLTSYYCYMFDLSLLMLAFVPLARHVGQRDLAPTCLPLLLTLAYFYTVPFFSSSLDRMMVYLFFGVLALGLESFVEYVAPFRKVHAPFGAPMVAH